MEQVHRRDFLAGAGAAALGLGPAARPGSPAGAAEAEGGGVVFLHGDGLNLTAAEVARRLLRLATSGTLERDEYSRGGAVAALEAKLAETLGKERAVFFATGTLANHIALRALAGPRRRVIVQKESHVYNDSGDCAQVLSGLHLIPLAPGGAAFGLDDVKAEHERAASGRVETRIGAVSIESPVRRRQGALVDFDEMRRISDWARAQDVGMHLDGARLFLAAPYAGRTPAQYAALFDTVYVSTWKYFNAPAGAILAGPRALLEPLFHARRMFGGSLAEAWPLAAVALDSTEGFPERFARAVQASEDLLGRLARLPSLSVVRVPSGSNVSTLGVRGLEVGVLRERLARGRVDLGPPLPDGRSVRLQVNETWTRMSVDRIEAAFARALKG